MSYQPPPMHKPVIVTDGGPWADHDIACPVCLQRSACLHLSTGVAGPCAECERAGWSVALVRPFGLRRRLFRMIAAWTTGVGPMRAPEETIGSDQSAGGRDE